MLARSVCVVARSSCIGVGARGGSAVACPSSATMVRASHARTRARSIGGLYGLAR